jgi:hypothetical protein
MVLVPIRPSARVDADKVTDANESAAVLALKAIATGQASYAASCGKGGFASSLVALKAFLDDVLTGSAKPERSGYRLSVAAGAESAKGPLDCHNTQTVTKYYASAIPVSAKTGSRSFALNQNAIIWTVKGGKAPTEPFGPPAQQIEIKK